MNSVLGLHKLISTQNIFVVFFHASVALIPVVVIMSRLVATSILADLTKNLISVSNNASIFLYCLTRSVLLPARSSTVWAKKKKKINYRKFLDWLPVNHRLHKGTDNNSHLDLHITKQPPPGEKRTTTPSVVLFQIILSYLAVQHEAIFKYTYQSSAEEPKQTNRSESHKSQDSSKHHIIVLVVSMLLSRLFCGCK